MKVILNTYIYQKLLNIIDFSYDKLNDKIDNFEGFLFGNIENNNLNIFDVKINIIDLNSELDFNLKFAIAEEELYSRESGYYIVGIFRSYNKNGLTPNPGDLLDLSILQNINPNSILMIFDIFQIKFSNNFNDLGFKFYKLEDPNNIEGPIIEIPYEIIDFDQNFIFKMINQLKTQQIPYAKIYSLINQAKINIQIGEFDSALNILLDARNLVGDRKDPDVVEKIETTIFEILYRLRNYSKLLLDLEILKKKYEKEKPNNLMGEIFLIFARVLIQMKKREQGLIAFDEAIRYFELSKNWKKIAFSYLLKGLVLLSNTEFEKCLLSFFQALSATSNLRNDQERNELVNKLNLEKNLKELVRTIPNKSKQTKYLNLLNEISEKHGYKIVLSDF